MSDDPTWLTEAIDAAATVIRDDYEVDYSYIDQAVRAALPIIREGLAKELEAAWAEALAELWTRRSAAEWYSSGLKRAAYIVRDLDEGANDARP